MRRWMPSCAPSIAIRWPICCCGLRISASSRRRDRSAETCASAHKDIYKVYVIYEDWPMAVVDDPEGAAERRARITRDLMEQTGIDDAMIERLVRTFYGRVQADPLI